jgi:hypothetical protein
VHYGRNGFIEWIPDAKVPDAKASTAGETSETPDPRKKLRNLKKKLTDIETLQVSI